MNDLFHKISSKVSTAMGTSTAFFAAVCIIVIWGFLGPVNHYSDTWQLVINTGTTIVTFLMVFLIQNTQNRDAKAIHLKLDELVSSSKGARNSMVNIEDMSDAELEAFHKEFQKIHDDAHNALIKRGKTDIR